MFTSETASEMQAKRKTRKGGLSYRETSSFPKTAGGNVALIVNEQFFWADAPRPQTDEEVIERIGEWFNHCIEVGIKKPTPSLLAIALRVSDKTLKEWRNGMMGEERAESIEEAYTVLHAIYEDDASNGGNVVWNIFASKNYFGMADKQEVEIHAEVEEPEETIDLEKLAQTYIQNLPPITQKKAIEMDEETKKLTEATPE